MSLKVAARVKKDAAAGVSEAIRIAVRAAAVCLPILPLLAFPELHILKVCVGDHGSMTMMLPRNMPLARRR